MEITVTGIFRSTVVDEAIDAYLTIGSSANCEVTLIAGERSVRVWGSSPDHWANYATLEQIGDDISAGADQICDAVAAAIGTDVDWR